MRPGTGGNMKNRLAKLGFTKIKNTGPGFHMWELDFKDDYSYRFI
jgi:hypothetical protein